MHILMTADAVGGVWTYTQELVSGLVKRGHRVTLVSFGKLPSDEQVEWMKPLAALEYQPTRFRLEWMQDPQQDIEASTRYLEELVRSLQPDILHLNQFAYGALRAEVPRVVVAHSDVVSWWEAVHNEEPPPTPWIAWYRTIVSHGLAQADAVVAPSRTMLAALRRNYPEVNHGQVIYNGRTPALFDPGSRKDNIVLSVGRLWDGAKQVSLLAEREHPIPIWIAGEQDHPDESERKPAGKASPQSALNFCGHRSPKELRSLYARAAIYAATSRYEPFGLAPLEAALSGCALIANDLPSFHEIWEDAAYYFRANSAGSLAEAIRRMAADPELRREYVVRAYQRARERFDAESMVDRYERLYREVAVQTSRHKHEAAA